MKKHATAAATALQGVAKPLVEGITFVLPIIIANVMKAHIGIAGLNAADVEFYKAGNVTVANYNTYREALWSTSMPCPDIRAEAAD